MRTWATGTSTAEEGEGVRMVPLPDATGASCASVLGRLYGETTYTHMSFFGNRDARPYFYPGAMRKVSLRQQKEPGA